MDATTASGTYEARREQFQDRLSAFLRFLFFFFVVLHFLVWAGTMTRGASLVGAFVHPAIPVIAFFGLAWRFFRGRPRSLRTLQVFDATFVLVLCAVAGLIPLTTDPETAEQAPYAAMTVNPTVLFLLVHAGMVPNTTRRTAIIHGLSGAVVGGFLVLYAARYPWLTTSMRPLWFELVWLASFVIASVYLSGVIWGLREQVRDALQLGQYRLEERLGEGGMGIVYRASHAMLRRKTAIKLLPPERAGEENLTRFEREVQQTARLTHPNTVSIFDYGRTPDGVFYYAMELLDGIDLERLVEIDGPQPSARVIHVLEQVCGALSEAHSMGLIHRDIKPANVILCRQGGMDDIAKVVDFGLVKSVTASSESGKSKLTGINQITGTPHYLAPEAITEPENVTARSDIYALGATAFFLLTGEPVFDGRSIVEVCSHHLHTPPDSPSERLGRPVDDVLDEVVQRCLSKDPEERPESAEVVAQLLGTSRLADTWTPRDARAWWADHEGELKTEVRPVGRHHSVVVDLEERKPTALGGSGGGAA